MPLHLQRIDWMPSPPLAPDDGPIDIEHLHRMTLGDASLEREVLAMFKAQAVSLIGALATLPADAGALAHTLKGSARAIGAFGVADAAGHLEASQNGATGFRPDRWRGAGRPVIGLPGPLLIPAARAIMAKIHFVDHSGETRTIDVENGATVMEAAIRNAVPGIEAECGGACACATCHVYVDEAWREKVGAPTPMEEDMLDFGFDVRPNSRLSCQIKVSDELDGLVVTTPERQA
jgi:2Fe-2S ferredoxin